MQNILIITLLFSALILSECSMTCKESRKLDDTCGGYCFQAVKSILGHTANLQEQVNKHNAVRETDVKADLNSIKRQLLAVKDSIALMENKFMVYDQSLRQRQKLFSKIGSKFYYIEDKERVNWFAAAHRCHELGGHLVSLQSKQEHNALKTHLNSKRDYWIDINDLGREGKFLSLTTGREATYLNWEPYTNNPNNADNIEQCGGLWNGNLLMNDFRCDHLTYFICESSNL